jgi:hypothetical protein
VEDRQPGAPLRVEAPRGDAWEVVGLRSPAVLGVDVEQRADRGALIAFGSPAPEPCRKRGFEGLESARTEARELPEASV